MKSILIAVDGSEGAHEALVQGIELARQTGAAATIVAVHQPPLPVYGDPYWQRAVTEELGRLRPVVADAVALAEEQGIEAEYEILEGDPAEQVVRLARARDVDLIVVGSRGLGAVASALLGSVSRRIAHDADRPVLVAKARAERVADHEDEPAPTAA